MIIPLDDSSVRLGYRILLHLDLHVAEVEHRVRTAFPAAKVVNQAGDSLIVILTFPVNESP